MDTCYLHKYPVNVFGFFIFSEGSGLFKSYGSSYSLTDFRFFETFINFIIWSILTGVVAFLGLFILDADSLLTFLNFIALVSPVIFYLMGDLYLYYAGKKDNYYKKIVGGK